MSKRPSLALTLIAKNEEHNLPILLESIAGCFDHIYLTDTGSSDQTEKTFLNIMEDHHIKYGTKYTLLHFDWIKDFSAARNHAIPHIKEDFWMWMDLDDSLGNKEAFIKWRDHAMEFADYHLATYNYAMKDGKPEVSFARERVFKTSLGMKFRYFVHEGVVPSPGARAHFITTWTVDHRRTSEDLLKDKGRNLTILEKNKETLDARMTFYYGKELFENGDSAKAFKVLLDASVLPDLELHDRIMTLQYACYAAFREAEKMKESYQQEWLVRAIQLAHQGLQLEPKRAEFHTILGDANLRLGRLAEALPYFCAAKNCLGASLPGSVYSGAIFNQKNIYTDYPRIQIAKIFYHLGRTEEAEKEVDEALKLYPTDELKNLKADLVKIKPFTDLNSPKEKVEDIVIVGTPSNAYEWDEELAKTKGMGGSETAAIEMGKFLKKLTGRSVKIFNQRSSPLVSESGVEYLPVHLVNEYFGKYEPKAMINWRHNNRLSKAPTYLWCHDLFTPTVESVRNFDKILCLSEFHKNYTAALQGVPEDQIIVTRNGITPDRFLKNGEVTKNPNKLLWMSSPDRGLEQAIKVCDVVRRTHPDIELHVYYGLENLYKYGLGAMADKLKAMIAERPWVKYHGFTQQDKMMNEIADGSIWIHPCNFIETFCITAIEMLCMGIYPVTRRLGALQNTLAEAEENGMATLLDHGCETEEEIKAYADAVVDAIDKKKWQSVSVDPEKYSWESVAKEWVNFMNL